MTTTALSTVHPASTEFMATVAARALAGKRRVFAGVGLPTLAVDLARRTVNPHLELVYESGVCGAHPEALAEGIADSVLVSGAAAEIMPNAGEIFVVLRRHDLGAMPAELDFCTSPSPVRSRDDGRVALPPGFGVSTVVTPLGVLRRDDRFGELFLASVHQGVTPEQVHAATGWPLAVSDRLEETPRPTEEDVRLLRDEIDTVRLYLR